MDNIMTGTSPSGSNALPPSPFSPTNEAPDSTATSVLPPHPAPVTPPPKVFKCAKCSRAFLRLLHLQQHEYTHTNYRPFACLFCNKACMIP